MAVLVWREGVGGREWLALNTMSVYGAQAAAGVAVTLSAEHDRFEWVSTEEAARRCRPAWVGALFRELA